MVWWQYNLDAYLADDGQTTIPAGTFSASVPNRIPDDQAAAATNGTGTPRPIGQVEGIEGADYNLYRMDLTQQAIIPLGG